MPLDAIKGDNVGLERLSLHHSFPGLALQLPEALPRLPSCGGHLVLFDISDEIVTAILDTEILSIEAVLYPSCLMNTTPEIY